jgi:MFS family permease
MSAVGTTLGPSLGGLLISGPGWRTIFLVNIPLGIVNFGLAARYLPVDRPKREYAGFDNLGTLLIACSLAAYALGVTLGRGSFGIPNIGLLLAAIAGAGLFVFAESKAASPLVRLSMFRDRMLSASLTTSTLVSTVMMATLVVGPFYLSRALGLDSALIGAVTSAGPFVAAMTGLPAGRLADRFGASRMTLAGLVILLAGCFAMAMTSTSLRVPGYLIPLVVLTAGYALFQAANNTGIMRDVGERRGVISGMLTLSRNLGLVTGASLMGAIFAHAAGMSEAATAHPEAVVAGLRTTYAVAAALIALALVLRRIGLGSALH